MTTLYHASPERDLGVLLPKPTLSKDQYIGDFVFATANRRLAAMYLATRGIRTLMDTESDPPSIVICDSEEHYRGSDKGGSIYTVPSADFIPSPQAGLETYEMVSERKVAPIEQQVHTSSLKAMKECGISVHFASKEQFDLLLSLPAGEGRLKLISEL